MNFKFIILGYVGFLRGFFRKEIVKPLCKCFLMALVSLLLAVNVCKSIIYTPNFFDL